MMLGFYIYTKEREEIPMDTVARFFSNYTIADLFAVITMVIVCIRGIEKLFEWIADKLAKYYKRKRGTEKKEDTIEAHSQEIKALTERIDQFANAVELQYGAIMEKVDQQQQLLDRYEEEGKTRDRAFLRDRINGGMRYFEQNKDESGIVHISVSDHENMEALFQEYFGADGNGTFKQIYENEFKKFIIDN